MDRHYVQQVCPFFATKFSLHERSRDSPFNRRYLLSNPEQRTTNQTEMKTIQRQEPDLGTGPFVKSRHADRGNPIAIPFLSIGHLWGVSVQSFHPPTARRARAESEAYRW